MTDDIESLATDLVLKLHARHDPNQTFHINDILGTENEPEWVDEVADYLIDEGLAEQVGMGGTRLRLTPKGQARARAVLRDQQDLTLRARAIRTRMLRWLHSPHQAQVRNWQGFLDSDQMMFLGDRLSEAEFMDQVAYLCDKRLLITRGSWQSGQGGLRPALTEAGRECVIDYQADVASYLRDQNTHGGTTVNQFHGINSGNFIIGDNNSNNYQAQTEGVDFSALVQFASRFSQLAPEVPGLSENDHATIHGAAAEIKSEVATAKPDVRKLQRLYDVLWKIAEKAGTSAATPVLIDLCNKAGELMHHLPPV